MIRFEHILLYILKGLETSPNNLQILLHDKGVDRIKVSRKFLAF